MDGMRDSSDDPEARRRQVALFRHAIIGELDIEALPRGERTARSRSRRRTPVRSAGGSSPSSSRSGGWPS